METKEIMIMRNQALCRARGELLSAAHTIYGPGDYNKELFDSIKSAVKIIDDECL